MFADMIVIVEGIVTVVEQRYDLYSWYMLLVVGGSRICNQIYLIPRAATWTLLLSPRVITAKWLMVDSGGERSGLTCGTGWGSGGYQCAEIPPVCNPQVSLSQGNI